MTFIFTVEEGTGDPDANSYVDVESAADYIGTNVYTATDWAALSDDDQANALSRASKYIDNIVQWNGTKVTADSGLRWPRAGVYDQDGFEIPDDVIPQLLKDAVCELASVMISEDWTGTQGTRGFKEIQVDVIDLKMQDNYVRPSLPTYVIDMLSPLGTVNRGTRPSFKRIIRT